MDAVDVPSTQQLEVSGQTGDRPGASSAVVTSGQTGQSPGVAPTPPSVRLSALSRSANVS